MTRSIAIALTLVLGTAATAAAQGMVVPNAPLTAEQTAALNAIRDARDSVVLASSLLASLQRDLKSRPAASLEDLARRIDTQCGAAERQRRASRKQLAAQQFTEPTMLRGQKRMLASMDELKKPLTACRSTWAPLGAAGKGEEVRGYGISRSRSIVLGLNTFEQSVVAPSKDLKLPVREVLRAGPSPIEAPAPVYRVPPKAS